MKQSETIHPDISDILKAKAERRRDIARRSFGEKIAMMEALRERVAPLSVHESSGGRRNVCTHRGALPDTARTFAHILRIVTENRNIILRARHDHFTDGGPF